MIKWIGLIIVLLLVLFFTVRHFIPKETKQIIVLKQSVNVFKDVYIDGDDSDSVIYLGRVSANNTFKVVPFR